MRPPFAVDVDAHLGMVVLRTVEARHGIARAVVHGGDHLVAFPDLLTVVRVTTRYPPSWRSERHFENTCTSDLVYRSRNSHAASAWMSIGALR
jgi:hypothetical protein